MSTNDRQRIRQSNIEKCGIVRYQFDLLALH